MTYMSESEEQNWEDAWRKWRKQMESEGFFVIHLEPGEMAVKYDPLYQSTKSEIVAARKRPTQKVN